MRPDRKCGKRPCRHMARMVSALHCHRSASASGVFGSAIRASNSLETKRESLFWAAKSSKRFIPLTIAPPRAIDMASRMPFVAITLRSSSRT